MSADKTRAGRLADALDAWDGKLMLPQGWREQTADELRRMSASEAALLKALESAVPEMAKGYSATQERVLALIARTKEARNA